MNPAQPPMSGEQRIGQYLLGRKLGEGGMGVVYLAHDPALDRDVAIKVLRMPSTGSDRAVKRFIREAQATARLNHPNVVTIHQIGQDSQQLFLVMELVDGGSLADLLLVRGPMNWRAATQAVRDAAAGLRAAHEAGLVHRDVKPSNLMRSGRGQIKVVDFGLARVLDDPGDVTLAGMMVGTPAYMSPEQVCAQRVDARSDIYSLGCTWYALMAGHGPFEGEDTSAVVEQHMKQPFPDPRGTVADFPEAAWDVMRRCTQKKPEDRYPVAARLIEALDAVLGGPGAAASPAAEPVPQPPAAAKDKSTVICASETAGGGMALAATTASQPAARSPIRNNLPAQLSTFIGRQRELADARQFLASAPLLTLTGPGGTGKTRLAIQAASDMMDRFADGVFLVELAPVSQPSFVEQAVASAAQVRERQGEPLAVTIAAALRGKSVLLILDNCEHLIDACAALAQSLLRGCSGLRIMATSIEPLGIAGEQVLRVPSLELPPRAQFSVRSGETSASGGPAIAASASRDPHTASAARPVAARDLAQFESVRLFVERGKSASPAFELTDANAAAVAHICIWLDGIPLALELAAARLRVLGVEQIAQRLSDRFKLLTGGSRTAAPRQRTLRALIDWSYDLLAEEERVLLDRLAVFSGGWTLEAAEAICGFEPIESEQILDSLARLVDKSLVVAEEHAGSSRYRLLESIRQYAQQKLDDRRETDAMRRRHCEWFTQWAAQGEKQLSGPEQGLWLARFDMDHDNLRAALDNCRLLDDAPQHALQLGTSLCRYWYMRGNLAEGWSRLEGILAMPATEVASPLRARVLSGAGVLAWYRGDLARGESLQLEAMSVAQKCGDREMLASSLNALGNFARGRGDLAAAAQYYEQALDIRRQLADVFQIAGSLNNLANIAKDRGDYARARELYNECIAMRGQCGDTSGVAYGSFNLGELSLYQGDLEQARQMYQRAKDALAGLSDEWGVAYADHGLAHALAASGDLGTARPLFQGSLDVVRRLGDIAKVGTQGAERARFEIKCGDKSAAAALLNESLAIAVEERDDMGLALCVQAIGELALAMNEPAASARLLAAAAEIRRQTGCCTHALFRPAAEAMAESLKQKLGADAFEIAWAAGAALPREQAVAEAREFVGRVPAVTAGA